MSSCNGCHHHYYPAPTYQDVVSAFKIIHKKEEPEKSFWAEGNIDFVQIGEKVVLQLPSVSKAIQSWDAFKRSNENWRIAGVLLGLGAFVLGVWRGWAIRSVIWTVGGSAIAYFFSRYVFTLNHNIRESSKAVDELTTMIDEDGKLFSAKLIFKTFRENLLRDGLEKFEEHRKEIPPAYPKTLLELFNQKELKGLLNRWFLNLNKLSPVERGQYLLKHDFFVPAFPKGSLHQKAAQHCYHCIRFFMVPQMKENVWIFRTTVVAEIKEVVKKCLDDHPQFKSLFEERFEKELKKFECTDEMIQEGIGSFFEKRLSLFADDPEQLMLSIRLSNEQQVDATLRELCGIICKKNLNDVFARIFSKDGVDNYLDYLKWVNEQFVKISDDYPNKKFLLSSVPKE